MTKVGEPIFYLQIVHVKDGAVARIPGGGALEADLVGLLTTHILSKGVAFKTRKHVEGDIRDGITQAFSEMKKQTVSVPR